MTYKKYHFRIHLKFYNKINTLKARIQGEDFLETPEQKSRSHYLSNALGNFLLNNG
jgi:hypothetical protein